MRLCSDVKKKLLQKVRSVSPSGFYLSGTGYGLLLDHTKTVVEQRTAGAAVKTPRQNALLPSPVSVPTLTQRADENFAAKINWR